MVKIEGNDLSGPERRGNAEGHASKNPENLCGSGRSPPNHHHHLGLRYIKYCSAEREERHRSDIDISLLHSTRKPIKLNQVC